MTAERQTLIAALCAMCDRYPHWRFGQLVQNVTDWANANANAWDVEDDQLLAAARAHLDRRAAAEQKASA